jgi:hypothetical protein
MKLKLKGRRFDTIEAESQRLLDTLTEMDFQAAFQKWKEGTTSRVMAADRPYGGFYEFYSVSPEYFGYNLVPTFRRNLLLPSYTL